MKAALSILVCGCATASKDIASTYSSPMQYRGYDCDQLAAESVRINVRANELAGRLDKASANDAPLVGVGMILFWPALLAVGGTKAQEAEYGRLNGEQDALNQAMVAGKCGDVKTPVKTAVTSEGATTSAAPAPNNYPLMVAWG